MPPVTPSSLTVWERFAEPPFLGFGIPEVYTAMMARGKRPSSVNE
ncbi:MAG: hypothetical protein ACP5L2_07830 [Conexivisphaera sp.]